MISVLSAKANYLGDREAFELLGAFRRDLYYGKEEFNYAASIEELEKVAAELDLLEQSRSKSV